MRKALLLTMVVVMWAVGTVAQNVTSSPLPIILITTDNGATIPDEPKIGATMKILYVNDNTTNYLSNQDNPAYLNYNGRIGIELRGSTSQDHNKKPYGFETRMDDDSTARNVSLLGMPAENDWVLNALNDDNSYLRDCLSYAIGRRTGRYTPRTKYCEVFVNGDYRGLYFLTEKIKIDDNRVDIADMDTSDNTGASVTGGYIVKADKLTGGDTPAWTTTAHDYWEEVNYIYHDPKPDRITPQQGAYIKSVFDSLQAKMDAANSSPADGYPSVIDVPSFVDYMIMGELSSNVDIYHKSTFFYKDRRGKLCAGPMWDFNLAYGNDLGSGWGYGRSGYNIWQFDNGDNTGSDFWYQLFNDPSFQCHFSRRWHQLTDAGHPLCLDSVRALIDSLQAVIDPVVSRDKQRWGIWASHTQNISSMKQWLQNRYNWISNQLGSYTACDTPTLPQLVISKIHYHPFSTNGYASKKLEFIGITNADTVEADLTGVYLSQLGLSYCFPAGSTLAPGAELFLAADSTAFLEVYGVHAFDLFARHLSDNSQRIVLADAWGNTIDDVTYDDSAPWPQAADGHGPFLILNDLEADNSLGDNWSSGTMLLPVILHDTLHHVDTLHLSDSLTIADTLFIFDTIFIFDTTIFTQYTILNLDTASVSDTLAHTDTIATADTILLTIIHYADSASDQIHVHPNPTAGLVTVSSATGSLDNIELICIDGRRITSTSPHTPSATIDLRHLPNGTYLLRVTTPRFVSTKRLIITH